MKDFNKDALVFVSGLLLFFSMLFGFTTYNDSMRNECRTKAIEKGMAASDIQVVCK